MLPRSVIYTYLAGDDVESAESYTAFQLCNELEEILNRPYFMQDVETRRRMGTHERFFGINLSVFQKTEDESDKFDYLSEIYSPHWVEENKEQLEMILNDKTEPDCVNFYALMGDGKFHKYETVNTKELTAVTKIAHAMIFAGMEPSNDTISICNVITKNYNDVKKAMDNIYKKVPQKECRFDQILSSMLFTSLCTIADKVMKTMKDDIQIKGTHVVIVKNPTYEVLIWFSQHLVNKTVLYGLSYDDIANNYRLVSLHGPSRRTTSGPNSFVQAVVALTNEGIGKLERANYPAREDSDDVQYILGIRITEDEVEPAIKVLKKVYDGKYSFKMKSSSLGFALSDKSLKVVPFDMVEWKNEDSNEKEESGNADGICEAEGTGE